MKHVLVTGGAGYVGSLLCPQLINLGYRVTVYDICYFGTNFLPLTHPRFTLIQGDIRNAIHLAEACKKVDIVISLACISNDASF
ncbi:MAG: NAD-dependent epimerase/dehydratase family protein, partial [Synechococcaceae cyanobacterium SM1_2_3]|nr:NAD-dependent epimerase/dehydratase family protein [Synechococcaceae cyanobacterium SM1_2_3]